MIKKQSNFAIINCLTPKPIKRFYVYAHVTENDEIFYVGKGSGNRAWICNGRGVAWDNIANNQKWKIKIFCENLDENQAVQLEKEIIQQSKKNGILTNIANTKGIV